MTVLRKALLGFLVACLAGACGSESRRDQDDPDAPVHLWPAPVFGAEDAGVRFVIAGHSGSHVGTLPIGDPSRARLATYARSRRFVTRAITETAAAQGRADFSRVR